MTKKDIIEQFGNYVSSGKVSTFKSYEMDFIIGKREGIYIWDINVDKALINCHCNGGVFNLGHRNPVIIETLKSALNKVDIGNHHLISEYRAMLGRMISELAPGKIKKTIFGVSGGEAVDLAIKIARGYTGRYKIISAVGGYHGHTGFALAAGDEKYRKPFGPMSPGFVQVVFNDIEELEKVIDDKTAGVIFETVPATLGIYVPSTDYFKEVRKLCDKYGALLIIDEVQTGLGRTGKLWGIENFGVVPDIMVIGKGLSGGILPITATCFNERFEIIFKRDPFIHISTFGGSELGCIVAMKVLEVSSNPEFLKHVDDMATIFHNGLEKIKERYNDTIVSIRKIGLMMGIKMKNEFWGPLMTKACYDNGLLCIYANNDRSVLQFLPPLIIKEDEVKEVLKKLESAFAQAHTKTYQMHIMRLFIKGEMEKVVDRIRFSLGI